MIPRLGQLNTGSSLSVHWLSKFGLIPGTDSLLMYRRTCRTAAPRVHGKVVRDGEDRFHEEDLDRSPSCPSSARPAGQSLPWTQRQRLRDCGPGGRPSPPAHPRRPTLFARPPSRCRNPTIRRSARCLIASPRLASCCWAMACLPAATPSPIRRPL